MNFQQFLQIVGGIARRLFWLSVALIVATGLAWGAYIVAWGR